VGIDRLAQQPGTVMLEERGERVHPASALLASESRHIESAAGAHRPHVFETWRRMDEILLANFMVFHGLAQEGTTTSGSATRPGRWTHYPFENPSLERTPPVWMADVVGWPPMPHLSNPEAALTADSNAEMIEHVARYPGCGTGRSPSAAVRTWCPTGSGPACPPSGSGRRPTTGARRPTCRSWSRRRRIGRRRAASRASAPTR